jgi:hypothetical protein
MERTAVERAAERQLLRNEWYKALIDPFTEEARSAYCPALADSDVVTDSTTVTVPIVADLQGRACIIFRPSLQAAYSYTNVSETDPSDPGFAPDITNLVYGAASAAGSGTFPTAGAAFIDSFGINLMYDMPKFSANAQKFSAYAPQSAGIHFRVTEDFADVGGLCYLAHVPGNQGLPSLLNESFNLGEEKGELMQNWRIVEKDGSAAPSGLTPANLSKLVDTREISLTKNISFSEAWAPTTPDVCIELRPTRYNPFLRGYAMDAIADTYLDGGNNNYWLLPPTCSTDPEVFRAFWDRTCTLNPWVNETQSAAGANIPVEAHNTTLTGYLIQDAAAATTKVQCEDMAKNLQDQLEQFQLSSCHDMDNYIVMLFEGVTPGSTFGYATFRMNFAAIDYTRSWQSASGIPRQIAASHTILRAARAGVGMHMRVEAAQDGQVFSSNDEDLTAKVKAGASAVADTAMHVADTVNDITNFFAEAAPVAGEIISALAAMF